MADTFMIDWQSQKNEVLFNPRAPSDSISKLLSGVHILDSLKGHVCFATSGSSGKIKWVVLPKEGFLVSAQAVNSHLKSGEDDIWLNPLPHFHVGGAGIFARGYLSKARVISCIFSSSKWSPHEFFAQLQDFDATLTALVPTQVFDLVSLGVKAPSSLRAVIVGGGAISESLYFAAVKLGWNLLPSYGLTECASQVATAEYGSWSPSIYPLLKPLDHIKLKLDEQEYLKIKSKSLLTAYAEEVAGKFLLRDPKTDGWLTTEDKAVFKGGWIQSISRGDHFVKVGGENVDLLRLEKILEEEKLSSNLQQDIALVAVENTRLGHCLHLVVTDSVNESVKKIVERYHNRVFPFERIHHIHSVPQIPRSPLNKVLKAQLIDSLKKE
jgi:O-succinylbenzoic acid--CoA ligase